MIHIQLETARKGIAVKMCKLLRLETCMLDCAGSGKSGYRMRLGFGTLNVMLSESLSIQHVMSLILANRSMFNTVVALCMDWEMAISPLPNSRCTAVDLLNHRLRVITFTSTPLNCSCTFISLFFHHRFQSKPSVFVSGLTRCSNHIHTDWLRIP